MKRLLAALTIVPLMLLSACGDGDTAVDATATEPDAADDGGTPADTETPQEPGGEDEGAAGSDGGDELTPVTVTFPAESITNAGNYVAQRLGYYEEAGLDVTFEYGPPNVSTQAMAGGAYEFSGAASGPVLTAIMRGIDFKIVMGSYSVLPFEIWGTEDIQSVEDLRGKSIAVEGPGSLSEAVVLSVLDAHGMSASDVNLLSAGAVPNWYASLKGGAADAAVATNAVTQTIAEKDGFRLVAAGPDYVDGFLSGLATTDQMIAEQPDVVQRFITATWRGMEAYSSDPELGVEIILSISPPGITEEDARTMYERDLPVRPENGEMTDDTVLSMAKILADLEGLDAPDTTDDIVDWSFIREASGTGS